MEKDGTKAWVICMGCFFINLCTLGFQFSFGVVFTELLQVFKESRSKTAWAGSISTGLSCFLAPVTMSLAKYYKEWQVMLAGVFCTMASLLLSSRATTIEELIFTFGILYGIGSSCLYPFTLTICRRCFDKRFSLSIGLSSTGTSIGPLIFTPLLNKAFRIFGWRTTFQIFAGVFAALLLFSFFCSYAIRKTCHEPQGRSRLASVGKRYLELFKHGPFMAYSLASAIIGLEYAVSFTHQVQYAVEMGTPVKQASMLAVYMGIGNIVGRIGGGFLFDLRFMNNVYLYQIIIFLEALTAFLGSLSTSYSHLVAYFLLLMMFDGGFQAQTFNTLCLLVEANKVYEAWQLTLLMQSFSIVVGPPLLGLIVDHTENYKYLFYVTGTPLAIAGLMLCLPLCCKSSLPYQSSKAITMDENSNKQPCKERAKLEEKCVILRETVL